MGFGGGGLQENQFRILKSTLFCLRKNQFSKICNILLPIYHGTDSARVFQLCKFILQELMRPPPHPCMWHNRLVHGIGNICILLPSLKLKCFSGKVRRKSISYAKWVSLYSRQMCRGKGHSSLHLQQKCYFSAFQWILLITELILFVTLLDFEHLWKGNNSKPKRSSSIHCKTRHRNKFYQ